jgi:hypothetical protein
MKNSLLVAIISLFAWSAWAEYDVQATIPNGQSGEAAVVYAVSSALNLAFSRKTSPLVPEDVIEGDCAYLRSNCIGAEVILKDEKNKTLDQQTINNNGFHFHGLEKGKKYRLGIQYTRYQASAETDNVHPGQQVHVEVTSKN